MMIQQLKPAVELEDLNEVGDLHSNQEQDSEQEIPILPVTTLLLAQTIHLKNIL